MYFADAITIVVACPFLIAMTHSHMRAVEMLIALPLIRVHHRLRLGETMHMRFKRLSVGVMHQAQAHLMTLSSNRPHNGGAVIVVSAMSPSLVGTPTGRVVWVIMAFSLLACVLEHFIGLCTGVRQSALGLEMFGIGLYLLAEVMDRLTAQFQFACQRSGGFSLADAT